MACFDKIKMIHKVKWQLQEYYERSRDKCMEHSGNRICIKIYIITRICIELDSVYK